jgi:hypothetical protein
MELDAIYNFLVGNNHISAINAALLTIIFLLARQRYTGIIEDFKCLQKSKREHEMTFLKHGMEIVREE